LKWQLFTIAKERLDFADHAMQVSTGHPDTRRIAMRRGILTSLTAMALWGTIGLNFAAAQFGSLGQAPPRPRPTVSPFINQGTGGINSYYGIVKPQVDANRSINELMLGVNRLNPDGTLKNAADQGTSNALGGLQTGHSAGFFNYGHYYPGGPPGGGTSSGAAGFGSTGLGGYTPGIGGTTGIGNSGVRTFFGSTMNQPLIR
jgi:hypothetical protein